MPTGKGIGGPTTRPSKAAFTGAPTGHSRHYVPTFQNNQMGDNASLGIAALEDKIVQRAVVEVLNAIYETDFVGFSYAGSDPDGGHA